MAYRSATRMYFDDPPPETGGVLKRWNGAAWVKALLKTYVAGTWQSKPMKVWLNGQWRNVDVSGV
jgi:hypothetical protein